MTDSTIAGPTVTPERASVGRVLRDQRKTIGVALVLAVAAFWVAGQFGEWRLASAIAVGVGIGLLLGLAVFRLIALVMTTIPLLKELKSQ